MKRAPILEVCAIIPARGGSKGLPRKNLAPLAGLPLIAHTVRAARDCPHIGACVVSTDDCEIAAAASQYGAEVIERPSELAGDLVASSAVVRHALEHLVSEYFVLLQPTSPLRTSRHLTSCIEQFFDSDARSAVSVTEARESPYKMLVERDGGLVPLFGADTLHAPRQTLPRVYAQNGAIYLAAAADFLATGRFLVDPVMPFVMDAESSIDIDTRADLLVAEALYSSPSRRTGKPFDLAALNRDAAWRLEMAAQHRERARRFAAATRPRDTCPICGASALDPFAKVFDYDYVTCRACTHLFCRTLIDDESPLYAAGSPQARVYLDEALFQKRVAQIARPKVDFVNSIAAPPGLWIDIGCATGELLAAARDIGWQTRGYECDPAEAAFGRAHGFEIAEQFVNADSAATQVAGAKVISLLNILEHLRDPRGLLCAIARAAAPDAAIVCEVPRHPSLSSFNSRAFPDLACRHIYPPDHLHIFTERSFDEMLAAAGLESAAVWTFGQDYQDLICCAAAAGAVPADDLYCSITALSARMQAAIDNAGLSDTLLAVARKRSGHA